MGRAEQKKTIKIFFQTQSLLTFTKIAAKSGWARTGVPCHSWITGSAILAWIVATGIHRFAVCAGKSRCARTGVP